MNDKISDLTVLLPSIETPTLTKAELSELLFERLGLNKRESKDMVEAFFEIVQGTLEGGQDVKLSGFGNFNIRRKAPRHPPRHGRSGQRRIHLPRVARIPDRHRPQRQEVGQGSRGRQSLQHELPHRPAFRRQPSVREVLRHDPAR